MWKVIRQRQGLPPNEVPVRKDSPYEANQRCALLHEVRAYVPFMSPTSFSTAYGDFIYVKIRRWLLDERAEVRQQAVEHLIELYTEKREHCVQSLAYDMLPILLSMIEKDESSLLRERAGAALEMLVKESPAQRLLLDEETPEDAVKSTSRSKRSTPPFLLPILATLRDACDEVVVSGLRVVLACHAWQNSFAVTSALVRGGLIPLLTELMSSTHTATQVFACSAARELFQVKEAHVDLLRLDVVAILTRTIQNADAVALVAEAAEVISLITEYPQGRRDAVTAGTLASLLPYLLNRHLTLRVAVYAATAQITVLESAKMQATELGIPETLVTEIGVEDERDVLMHMLRLLTNLAEWPPARLRLRECLPRIAALQHIAEGDETVLLLLGKAEALLKRNITGLPKIGGTTN